MTTLAKDKPRIFGQGIMNDLPVEGSEIIYEGAFVGENASGYSRPLVAGDPFQGVCKRQADNSLGSAGGKNVRVQASGILSNVAVAGATAITVNDFPPVYASDDDTLTLTKGSNTLIGNVLRWISSGICDVSYSTPRPPSTVGLSDMEANSVDSDQYVDGSIDLAHMSAESVDSDQYVDGSIDLAHMSAGITSSHIVKFAAEVAWSGGGASLAVTVTGALATDIVVQGFLTIGTEGTVLQGVASSDTVTFTLDTANTSNDAVISYVVLRAAA